MNAPSSPQASDALQFDLSEDDQSLFLAEVDEILQRFEEALVDLERTPNDEELLQEIFRAAHTIKGNSATIGQRPLHDVPAERGSPGQFDRVVAVETERLSLSQVLSVNSAIRAQSQIIVDE